MRALKLALMLLIATGCLAFACDETRPKETLRENPPVIDDNGFVRSWANLPPEKIIVINRDRQALGLTKGAVPGF